MFLVKNKVAAVLAPFGLIIGLSAGAVQAQDGPFVTSSDGVGVKTGFGECWGAVNGTPDAEGCVTDSDGDGVPDHRDRCPNTPKGCAVDEHGCPLDSDGDGVIDCLDKCPGTPAGAKVDTNGCEIIADLTIQTTTDHFDFDSAELKPAMKTELDNAATQIKASKGNEILEVIGHTDSTGPADYNQGLSERRAQAAADYLSEQGVAASQMTVKGMGEADPVADNATREGRAMNRRVDLRTQ